MKKFIKIAAIAGMLIAAVIYGLRSGGYLNEKTFVGTDVAAGVEVVGTDSIETDAGAAGGLGYADADSTESESLGDDGLSGAGGRSTGGIGSDGTENELSGTFEGGVTSQETSQQDAQPAIMVHVCGCVASPGVYGFAEGARLYEAVEAAGGFTEDADETYMNLAAYLSDGIKIYVPAEGEIVNGTDAAGAEYTQIGTVSAGTGGTGAGSAGASGSGSSDGTGTGTSDGKVDINTADEAELQTLPGIGPSRAADIVSYRKKNGAFSSIEDIMNVPGIKEAAFSKIKDMIAAR